MGKICWATDYTNIFNKKSKLPFYRPLKAKKREANGFLQFIERTGIQALECGILLVLGTKPPKSILHCTGIVHFLVSYNRGSHPKFLLISCLQFVWSVEYEFDRCFIFIYLFFYKVSDNVRTSTFHISYLLKYSVPI